MVAYFDIAIPRNAEREKAAADRSVTAEATAKAERLADQFLKQFDLDEDGSISLDELPDRARSGLSRFDINGDKSISRDELIQLLVNSGRKRP
ncbi:MAG: EF-hand domain-containing protein [Pirellulales bacterium]|nr:EF-hand domain-containing protein [Pirellulales bacterium]